MISSSSGSWYFLPLRCLFDWVLVILTSFTSSLCLITVLVLVTLEAFCTAASVVAYIVAKNTALSA